MQLRKLKSENTRDFLNFVTIRQALPKDDGPIGDFLLDVFDSKQRELNPDYRDNEERVRDLLDVRTRRENGVVVVFEMGYQIVATFALIHPETQKTDAWIINSSLLRCVAVKRDFHRLDLSMILLKEADRVSLQLGAHYCCLHVNASAPNVGRVYEKQGFLRDHRGDRVISGNPVLGFSKKLTDSNSTGSSINLTYNA